MSESLEQFSLFLPKYLSPDQSQDLFEGLKQFPDWGRVRFYGSNSPGNTEILQSDGWRAFVVIDFHSTRQQSVRGIVLSNSCDIDLNNARYTQRRILFSPIISLEKFAALLRRSMDDDRVVSILESIRKQRSTSVFYLPPGDIEESLVQLDDIHTQPLDDFLDSQPTRLFTLSQPAFYLFLFKLSVHFMRMQEGVIR